MNKKIILYGTLDPENPLALLRANPLVWTHIFKCLDEMYKIYINNNLRAYKIFSFARNQYNRTIKFPKPKNIQINMMPVNIFKKGGLPIDLIGQEYKHIIERIIVSYNKIMYLTIDERLVPVGESHRRAGLHIERPGAVTHGGHIVTKLDPEFPNLAWGLGHWHDDIVVDGIFMASSVDDSCIIYPCQINNPQEVSDKHGGIEHMREYLPKGELLKANELCWFTDTTPHESLPLKPINPDDKFVYRQFLRIVSGRISVWYSQHNTPNPSGLLPDCPISDDNKFN